MPIEIVAPTIVRIGFRHLLGDARIAENIVDISVDEVGTTRHDAVADVVNNARDKWQTRFVNGMMGNSVTFVGGHFTDLDSLGGISGDFAANGSLPTVGGGGTGTQMPPNNALLIVKHCTHTRRQRPGRMYVTGVMESAADNNGVVPGSIITAYTAVAEGYKTDALSFSSVLHPATTAWRVVHIAAYDGVAVPGYPHGLPNAWNSTDVSSAVCDARIATMRRRLRG